MAAPNLRYGSADGDVEPAFGSKKRRDPIRFDADRVSLVQTASANWSLLNKQQSFVTTFFLLSRFKPLPRIGLSSTHGVSIGAFMVVKFQTAYANWSLLNSINAAASEHSDERFKPLPRIGLSSTNARSNAKGAFRTRFKPLPRIGLSSTQI